MLNVWNYLEIFPVLDLIWRKSSYRQSNLKKKKKKKTCMELEFYELEFHAGFFKQLNFHRIKFSIETRFSKNRVSK